MSGIKIIQLPAAPSAQLTDVFPVSQSLVTYKESNAQLLTLFQENGQTLNSINDTNVTMTLSGSPSTALLNATSLTLGWTGTLSGARGGTGIDNSGLTINLGSATSGFVLTSDSMGNATWQEVSSSGSVTTLDGDSGSATPSSGAITISGASTGLTFTGSSHTLSLGGTLKLSNGGTNANLTASNGGIFYSTATAAAILSGTATANLPLLSQSSTAPIWGSYALSLGGALTTAGALTLSGAYGSTFTFTNTTSVTFPTSGTLATTSQLPTPAALTSSNDTNVTITLGGTPSTSLLQATSLTMGWSGQLGLTRGGTAASLTASNGGIIYSTASALAVLSGTSTAGQLLTSGASTTPAWTTSTYPATNAANTLLYASSANTMAALATANSSVLVTSSGGVPSLSTTLPSGLSATNLNLTTPTLGAATATSIKFSPTTGGIIGTTTNDNAPTGTVGEFVSSFISQSSPVSLSANTPTDLTSISLTAGDWDVWGNITFGPALTTNIVILVAWLNSSSATIPDDSLYNEIAYGTSGVVVGGAKPGVIPPAQRFSLASTTTIYITAYSTFSVSTLNMGGGIYARRLR